MNDIREFYNSNKDFQTYVDKYARARNLPVDEALGHRLVNIAAEYYKALNEENKHIIKGAKDE